MMLRSGEEPKSWFRTDRFYHTEEGWWFQTRERIDYGPFNTMEDANCELLLFLRSQRNFASSFDSELTLTAK